MNIIAFIFSIFLLSIAVYCQQKMLKLADGVDKILAWFVLFPANIVLITYILSELIWVSLSGYLFFHIIFAVLSAIIYYLKFRKNAGSETKQPAIGNRFLQKSDIYLKWTVKGLFIVIAVAALFRLFIGIYMPVTTVDAMTCHLSRVGYWLQNGTLHHYYIQPGIASQLQNFQAPNIQILILWTVTLLKSDILANTIQWFAYCGIGFSIYQAVRNFGFDKQNSLFSSLIYLSLPMVVLQSISTFYDLGVTFFTITFFYFFHSSIKHKDINRMILSSISFGLAVGSKGTIFYMFPALFTACLILIFIHKPKKSFFKRIIISFVLGFLLFGSYNYIQNWIDYGNPIAPKECIKRIHQKPNVERLFLNLVKYGFDAIEFRGLPDFMVSYLNEKKKSFYHKYLSGTYISKYGLKFRFWHFDGYNNHEAMGWFGVLGTTIFFPVLFYFLFSHYRSRERIEKWIYAFIPAFFFLYIFYLHAYMYYKTRYFVLPLVFVAPLVASVFTIKRKSIRVIFFLIIALIAAKTTIQNSIYSRHKPLFGKTNIFNNSIYQNRIALKWFRLIPFARFISEFPAANSRIGHILGPNRTDYLFFDKNFKRTVIPIKKQELANGELNIMKKYNLDFLVIDISQKQSAKNFDPLYFSGRKLPNPARNTLFRVIPNDSDWNEVLKKHAVLDRSSSNYNIPQLINIFGAAENLNKPLRILLGIASNDKGIKEINIGGKKYLLPPEKPIIKQNKNKYSYNVLAFSPGKSKIVVKGKVIGYTGTGNLKLINEKGRLVLNIPVDQNGSFNCELLTTEFYPVDSQWKLFQIRISEPENKTEISESDINIFIDIKNPQKKG
jgi:hypothetical protein